MLYSCPAPAGQADRRRTRASMHVLCLWASEGTPVIPSSVPSSLKPVLQIKPAGAENWSVAQRSGAVVRNGAKLLGVGFFASLFGVTITNTIVKVGR